MVFPARAGMSRNDPVMDSSRSRVPRASGDEPDSWLLAGDSILCSPRERG